MSQTTAQLIDNLVQPLTGADGTAGAPTFSFTDDTNTGIYSPGADQLAISTGGTNSLLIDSSGRVGIGTNSPGYDLVVADAATSTLQILSGGSTNLSRLLFADANDIAIGRIIYDHSDDSMQLFANNNERMRIDSSGRLLVGTTSARTDFATTPQVQVEGTSSPTSSFSLTRNSSDTGRPTFFFGKSRGTSNGSTNVVTDGDGLGTIEWAGGDGDQLVRAAYIAGFVDGTPGNNDMPGRLSFWTTADGASSPTERMRIDSSGRVGIGTSSPGSFFSGANQLVIGDGAGGRGISIYTSSTENGYLAFNDTGNTTSQGWIGYDHATNALKLASNEVERVRIDSSGNVGIGTTSPNGTLSVAESGNGAKVTLQNTSSVRLNYIGLGADDDVIDIAADENNQGSNSAITLRVDGSERARIDSSGRLLVGTTNALDGNMTTIIRGSSGGTGVMIARASAPSDGQSLGTLYLADNQGNQGAYIDAARDSGTWTQGSSHPTRLVFATADNGAQHPSERMRIESNGDALLGTTNGNDYSTVDGRLNVVYPSTAGTNTHCIKAYHTNTSFAENGGGLLFVASRRSASSSFTMAGWYTGNDTTSITSDRQFRFRGDGNGYCDGSWNGGGADYAEYFEWFDGNATAEDRRGISVVLDNDKIREAVAGEEPIGVISGNPSVVGDADDNRWKKKYLRDDFGSYVWEDYNPIDDDGNPKQDDDGNLIVQQRQKLNPNYNPDIEYVPREDRPEWDCVGLMGKLRIRKGQVTGARWIKMRDISDNVEEWLVR